MNIPFKFTCSCCGEVHEGSPSFGFESPFYYVSLSEEDKKKSFLSSDRCSVLDEDYFIRTILEIPILGYEKPFLWGVWVSVSKVNFDKYLEQQDSLTQSEYYFGWLSNKLPYYPNTLSLKTHAYLQPNNQRPILDLEATDHQLSLDYHNGISWDTAVKIAEVVIHDKKA